MDWDEEVIESMKAADVEVVAYLPDSIISNLIRMAEEEEAFTSVRVAREEEAVGVLAGAWLGGKRGALICQSSGLANCFNALASHSIPNGLPFLGLVTRRGDLGEYNFAQVTGGYAMPRLLDTLGVRNRSLDVGDPIPETVERAVRTAALAEQPYVLLLERNLTGDKPE